MAADGAHLDDEAAVDRWISSYNALLADVGGGRRGRIEVVDLKEAFGLPEQMAPLLPVPRNWRWPATRR